MRSLKMRVRLSQNRGSRRNSTRQIPNDLRRFVRRVTEPSLAPAADPRQADAVALIDRALGSQMRALLHAPDFQAMEAAWRAVFLLVRRLETGTQLKLYLIDISKAELAADLDSAEDSGSSGLSRLLVDESAGTPGGDPWTLIVGNYSFGPTQEDAKILTRLAKIASREQAPVHRGRESACCGLRVFRRDPLSRGLDVGR